MFIEIEEMRTIVFPYQMCQVTDNNEEDITIAITKAIEEVKGYLGRYDTEKVFTSILEERTPSSLVLPKLLPFGILCKSQM